VITGGHFSPALSVIEKLGKEHTVIIIGRKTAMEGDSTPSLEYTISEKKGIVFKIFFLNSLLQEVNDEYTPNDGRLEKTIEKN
jgi:UDP-N-acetylglucosamine:LPS N-acetylglucosamine transferase